jgi:hypothetical protein
VDAKLIKANIALFNGSRSEVRRLLAEFTAEHPRPAEDVAPLVMWLDAQAADDRATRMEKLAALVEKLPKNNKYVRIAADTLEQEDQYASKGVEPDEPLEVPEDGEAPAPARTLPKPLGVDLWKAGAFAAIGLMIGIVVISLLGGSAGQQATQVVQNNGGPLIQGTPGGPPPTLAPDRSIALDPTLFRAEYESGILEISAVEDNSGRIVDEDGVLVRPIPGARLVAVRVAFECNNGGVCGDVPEADLFITTDSLVNIEPMRDVGPAGESRLPESIASGSRGAGWVVFQVPNNAIPAALTIIPPFAFNEEPQPIIIPLALPSDSGAP